MADEGAGEHGSRVSVLWSGTAAAGTAERLVQEGLRRWRIPATGVRLFRLCPTCGSDRHGRPVLTPLATSNPHLSLSRAGQLTVVALCDAGPVGVDVEAIGAAGSTGIAPVALHPRESARSDAERTVTWVRKESLVKATGQGLTVDLAQVRVSEPSAPPALVEWTAADPPAGPVWLYDVRTAPGHVTAVSVLSAARPRLALSREVQAARASAARRGTARRA